MMATYLGDIGVLESSLRGDSVPVNVGLVSSVLDNAEEQHSFGGSGLFLIVIGHGSVVL
jgi:hypothetical protein